MENVIKIFYAVLPKTVIIFLGKNRRMKRLRDFILRPNNEELITGEEIIWGKGKFIFFAPLKMAVKAKNKGIESKLLRSSIKLIEKYKIEKPVVLDIGANYGFISLALQTNLCKEVSIYSFEPHPSIFKVFQKSISENNIKNIILENVAIGKEDCDVELNLYGQTSNVLNFDKNNRGKTIIKQINLDNYLSERNIQPNFIKIDVDGYEANVLNGLKNTIEKFKPIMVVETNDDQEVINILKSMDYKLFNLDLEEFEGIPNNVFCI